MTNKTIHSVIRQIVDMQGVDILLDSTRFWAFFNDLYLDSAQTKKIFQRALNDTVLQKFYDIYFASSSRRRELLTKVKHYLSNDLGFSEDWANIVVVSFSDAFNWGYKTTVVAKSHTPSKTKPSSSNTSTSTSVDLSFLFDDSFDFSDSVPTPPVTNPSKTEKKKPHHPAILLGSILLVLILGLAAFFVIRSESAKNDITLILEAAESAAGSNNFDEAISLIEEGLNAHPNSELLLEAQKGYANKKIESEIAAILSNARMQASSGDYLSAMALLRTIHDKYGTTLSDVAEDDWNREYTEYHDQYLSNVLLDADSFAEAGDYLSAYKCIKKGLNIVGDNPELAARTVTYENLYIEQVVSDINSMIESNDFESATSLISETKIIFPKNQALEEERLILEDAVFMFENEWESENNDTFQTATRILLNKAYHGVLQDKWDNGEQDWYVFSLEAPGMVTVIFESPMQSSNENFWDISIRPGTNPDEDLWQKYVTGYTTTVESVILALPAGTYYVEVESSNEYSEDTYSFLIDHEENPGTWEIESNDTFQSANEVTLNSEYFGVLQNEWDSGEQDWYVFSLDAQKQVSLVFNSNMQGNNELFWDICIRSSSNPDEDLWQKFIEGYTTQTNSGILTLPAGVYYVEIESSNNYSPDPYSFTVNVHE